MKNTINVTALALMFLNSCFFAGCSKKEGCTNSNALNFDKDAEEDNGSCQVAGLGGNTIIVGKPQHHGLTIYNQAAFPGYPNGYLDTAYVKFNAKELPGIDPSLFDALFVGEAGHDHVRMEGLKTGYYYIFMAGYDTSGLAAGSPEGRVTGGIPYTLSQATGEVDLAVPLTE
ncbi:MAG: hypothetical protein ABIT08_02680 [Bacteroidia bacterium]